MRKFFGFLGLALCIAVTLLTIQSRAPKYGKSANLAKATPASAAHVSKQYGKLPLSFEPNLGQTNGDAKFLAHGDGYSLFLTSNEAVLALRDSSKGKSAVHAHADVLRMQLVGSDPSATFSAIDELPGKANYLIGKSQSDWHTNVPMYRKVAENGIYPGVDLVYYGTQRQLEYDFIVAPGAAVAPIRLSIQGGKSLKIDNQGELVVSSQGGDVVLHKPVAYQEAGNEKQLVAANYALDANNEVHFKIGNYDRTRALVIDPILAYSTYLGGSNIDGANAIAVASDNTAFVAGGTSSLDFPTAHPLQANDGGEPDFPQDAFVSKFSADGSTLLYSTYLGGNQEDLAYGIAVDDAGDAYVTGKTDSPNFPTTIDAVNVECGGDAKCGASFNPGGLTVFNGFLSKLNPAGSALLYSTFIGYYENVICFAVAVDQNQIAYVTGSVTENFVPTVVITPPATPPPPFPITTGVAYGGGTTDAFVVKISSTGGSVLYSTYLGGDGEDIGYGIAADKNADAYVTGLTYSPAVSAGFPVSAGAFQGTYGGAGDAFFTELNTNVPTAIGVVYSTYLGGVGLDQGNAIVVDSSPTSCTAIASSGTACDAYIAGGTGSSGLGASAMQADCALDNNLNPPQCAGDAFVAEFNPNLSGTGSRVFFSYLGGSLADSASGIALDQTGNIYIAGSTVSTNFPVCVAPLPVACAATAGPPFQATYGGGNDDAFVAKIDATTLTLDYSSYLGGTDTDNAYGIAVDTSGSAYIAGQTCSTNFPVSNPEQITPGGNCDAFVSKVSILNGIQLNPASLVFPAQSSGTSSAPETVTITNGDNTLTGLSVGAPTGPDAGDFASTTTCPATLNPGAQCTVTVTFTPSASGVAKAAILLTDSAPDSPQTISLTGTTSTLTLSASSLSFGTVPVGTTSAPQTLTATNQGTTALTFSSITASGNFAEADNCTKAPVQPSTTCTIQVTFTPSGTGSSVGSLTINDNAPGSPQVVLLNGSGIVQDFTLTASTKAAVVSAGQSANFSILITPIANFSQPVTLSCAGLPANAQCVTSQNPVTPSGSTPVTVTITTGARTLVPPTPSTKLAPPSRLMAPLICAALASLIVFFMLLTMGEFKNQRAAVTLMLALSLMLFTVACGGGSTAGTGPGTPAGTYQITITGTSGSASQSTTVQLQVN
jgi:Abnormal spindle-like microcephaly-assoc'd, ASPM-SPD-2-Hydin/Beta-propeller repeat